MRGYCWLCGQWGDDLEEHHIFGGKNRKLSTKYGLTVYLHGAKCHRLGPNAVHVNPETAQMLHEYGEKKWIEMNKCTIRDFVRVFGRNYLDVPPDKWDEMGCEK